MRPHKFAMTLGATLCLVGAGTVALAASTPKGGHIRIFSTNTSATKGKILITGAIGDYGTTVSRDANGKVDPNGNFDKVTLRHGSFIVNATKLDKKLNHTKPTVNKTTCSVVLTGSAPTTVGHGTGAYKGISGTIAVTLTFAGIAPKTTKGCDLANSAPFYGEFNSITGTGTVSFK